MKVTPASLPGLLVVEPDVHHDARGFFVELGRAERYAAHGIVAAAQQNLARSVRGVLRGLHYQQPHPQGKLVTCVAGRVYDVAVDLRRGSPAFGRWEAFELSGDEPRQLWLPPGFAHGFCVLSVTADVLYAVSAPHDPAADRAIRWDDPDLAIPWPITAPILSARDAAAPRLRDAAVLPAVDEG